MTTPSAAANAYASLARIADPSSGLGKALGETQGPSFGALLKDAVTTPSGTTIDGILELEEGGLRVALLKAVVRATRRATERAHELFGDVPR